METELIPGIWEVCNKVQSVFLPASGSLGFHGRSPEIAESEGREEGVAAAAAALVYPLLHT